jgi:carboxylesterase type B
MQWVVRNIANFGGDPSTLMVFGESAGAGSISAHLVSPRSSGLFKSALMESGPDTFWVAKTMAESENDFQELVNGSFHCAGKSSDALLACMLSLTSEELLKAQGFVFGKLFCLCAPLLAHGVFIF